MSATTPADLRGLQAMTDQIKHGRKLLYENGVLMTLYVNTVQGADDLIEQHERIIADLRKWQAVEAEALAYDKAGGRDYNELFAILSPEPTKEKA